MRTKAATKKNKKRNKITRKTKKIGGVNLFGSLKKKLFPQSPLSLPPSQVKAINEGQKTVNATRETVTILGLNTAVYSLVIPVQLAINPEKVAALQATLSPVVHGFALASIVGTTVATGGIALPLFIILANIMVYFKAKYLRFNELRATCQTYIDVCNYIMEDAIKMNKFYEDDRFHGEYKNEKLAILYDKLTDIILISLSYLNGRTFKSFFKEPCGKAMKDFKNDEKIKEMYNLFNTDEIRAQCKKDVTKSIEVGNVLIIYYILERLKTHSAKGHVIKTSKEIGNKLVQGFSSSSKVSPLGGATLPKIQWHSMVNFLNIEELQRTLMRDYININTFYTMAITKYMFDYNEVAMKDLTVVKEMNTKIALDLSEIKELIATDREEIGVTIKVSADNDDDDDDEDDDDNVSVQTEETEVLY